MSARPYLRAFGATLGAAATAVILAGAAGAAEYPPPGGTPGEQEVSDETPAPGQEITAAIDGMLPNESGTTTLFSTPVQLGTWKADANGAAKVTVTIPTNTEKCLHSLVSKGSTSGNTATSPLAVGGVTTACASEGGSGSGGGSLPKTGAQVLGIGLLGTALVGGGITLRRRAKANA